MHTLTLARWLFTHVIRWKWPAVWLYCHLTSNRVSYKHCKSPQFPAVRWLQYCWWDLAIGPFDLASPAVDSCSNAVQVNLRFILVKDYSKSVTQVCKIGQSAATTPCHIEGSVARHHSSLHYLLTISIKNVHYSVLHFVGPIPDAVLKTLQESFQGIQLGFSALCLLL